MTLHSRFKFWVLLPVVMLLIITGSLIVVSSILINTPGLPMFGLLAFILFFVLLWAWIFFGELRTKAVKVELRDNEITCSGYLGLGKKKVYYWKEFNGFETSLLPSQFNTYEFLYLLVNGKKKIKLSEYYHSNYAELKELLMSRVNDLGQKKFSFQVEVKEIFK